MRTKMSAVILVALTAFASAGCTPTDAAPSKARVSQGVLCC